ncbi:MAG: hypothetical protein LBH95_04530 [Oscillospiraceae bacterium]|jgi:flagellar motility protein MotE (MotC chaperone)|nr:hypothetical protein [Oscillospiraceae bacterium]
MAAAAKQASGDVKKAQTLEELEREALGPKNPAAGEQRDVSVRKGVGKIELAVLVSLVWLALIGAFVLLVLFDPTEDRVIRGMTLLLLNPDEETREEYWADDIYLNQEWERELDDYAKELEAMEDALDLREEELDDREDELDDREIELEAREENIHESGGGAEVLSDVVKTAKTVSRMTAQEAANTLTEIDFDSALRICLLIPDKKLAPILDVMDPDFRVELVEALAVVPDEDEDW